MTYMEAWLIISRNMNQLYATRDKLGITPYTDDETQAEVMCFNALRKMQEQEDDCK